MGDYARFMYRVKEGNHDKLLSALQKSDASISAKYDSQLGIIYGIAKTSYPEGCKLVLRYEIDSDLYEALAVINEHHSHTSDCFYSEGRGIDTD